MYECMCACVYAWTPWLCVEVKGQLAGLGSFFHEVIRCGGKCHSHWSVLPASPLQLPSTPRLWDEISCISGWPQTGYVAKDGLQLLSLLPLPPRCWDHTSTPSLFAAEDQTELPAWHASTALLKDNFPPCLSCFPVATAFLGSSLQPGSVWRSFCHFILRHVRPASVSAELLWRHWGHTQIIQNNPSISRSLIMCAVD